MAIEDQIRKVVAELRGVSVGSKLWQDKRLLQKLAAKVDALEASGAGDDANKKRDCLLAVLFIATGVSEVERRIREGQDREEQVARHRLVDLEGLFLGSLELTIWCCTHSDREAAGRVRARRSALRLEEREAIFALIRALGEGGEIGSSDRFDEILSLLGGRAAGGTESEIAAYLKTL